VAAGPDGRPLDVIGGNVATAAGAAALVAPAPTPSGRRRARLDLHDPGRRRGRRAASDRHLRGGAGGAAAGVPVIGDGGLQHSGDIAKAITVGPTRSCSAACWPASTRAPAS